MATHRAGLVIRQATTKDTIDAIVRAEEQGVTMVWSTVGGTSADAITVYAAAAERTSTVTFGTSIVPIFPRHPLVLATQALVLADLAPGRFRLGVGPSHRPIIEGMFGIPFSRPLTHLQDYVTVLRQLLWEGRVDFDGEVLAVHQAALPASTPAPRIPILISALRVNAFRLAGEIADGAISWVCPVDYLLRTALPALRTGAETAGRPIPPLVAHIPVALHTDRAAVRAAARSQLQYYGHLPFYVQMFSDAGFPIPADGSLPDALLDDLVVSGDQAAVAARLEAILAQGLPELAITQVVVSNAEAEERQLLEVLARVSQV